MSEHIAIYHPKAPGEARSFYTYYSDISDELGKAFWDELLSTLETARAFPTHHHFDSTDLRRASLKRFPVHILFRDLPLAIRITTIRHD